jgi:Fic family protein
MLVTEKHDPQLYNWVREKNLLRQSQLLIDCVTISLKHGHSTFSKATLCQFNHVAVANISQFGGRLRRQPVYVGSHVPPHFKEVPELVDDFVAFIHENWWELKATELAAYSLWRLNWIHPFVDGNGRTARATAYFLLNARFGRILPGQKTVPERIRENRAEYENALKDADRAWEDGHLDFGRLENFIATLLMKQLRNEA